MQNTYIDSAKQESRVKQLYFCKSHIKGNPKEAKVLCIPGAEKVGEEALEVKEVYDNLGVLRENITGIERDHVKAERLRNAGLGMKIEEATDLDVLLRTQKKYDIISLDYTGQQTRNEILSLKAIAGRQLLEPDSILLINYSGKRESKRQQAQYLWRVLRERNTPEEVLKMMKSFEPGQETAYGYTLKTLRDAVSIQICGEMFDGIWASYIPANPDGEQYIPSVLRTLPTFEEAKKEARRVFNEQKGTRQYIRDKKFKLYAKIFSKEDWEITDKEPEKIPPFFFGILQDHLINHIEKQLIGNKQVVDLFSRQLLDLGGSIRRSDINALERKFEAHPGDSQEDAAIQMLIRLFGAKDRRRIIVDYLYKNSPVFHNVASSLAHLLIRKGLGQYLQTVAERYSYTSNKNTLMLVDMFAFTQKQPRFDVLDSVICYESDTKRVIVNPNNFPKRKFERKFSSLILKTFDNPTEELPPRIHLGSSWKPRRKFTLTREEILDLYTSGLKTKEIADIGKDLSSAKVAAVVAHANMGTYDRKPELLKKVPK